MKKYLNRMLGVCLASGLVLGGFSTTVAADVIDPSNPQEMVLLGPDRSQRAPQRAIQAPVDSSTQVQQRERETVVTPPPPPVQEFVYEKRVCPTLTNVRHDINGQTHHGPHGPSTYVFEDGAIHMWSSTDRYYVNRLGAMGADREFLNPDYCDRLGVWTNGRIAGQSPESIVTEMTERFAELACVTWSDPAPDNVAGIPVIKSTGYDIYGNYFYEVYALERYGNTYAFATRIPYKSRYNVKRNTNLEYMISHIHPSTWVE